MFGKRVIFCIVAATVNMLGVTFSKEIVNNAPQLNEKRKCLILTSTPKVRRFFPRG